MRNYRHLHEERFSPEKAYEDPTPNWPGDFPGRIMFALALEKEALGLPECDNLDRMLVALSGNLNKRGYVGEVRDGVFSEQQMSGNGWVLRALAEYDRSCPSNQVVDAKAMMTRLAENLFLPALGRYKDYPITPEARTSCDGGAAGSVVGEVDGWLVSSDIGCLFIGLDGLVAAYKCTGDEKLRPAIEEIVARLMEFDFVRVKAQTHATLSAMRALLRCDAKKYLSKVEDMFRIYREQGMTDGWENYNWFGRFDTWTEPYGDMNSHNHAMMAGVEKWMYTRILGIRQTAPGEVEVVEPIAPTSLEWARGFVTTPQERIDVEWQRDSFGKIVRNVNRRKCR